MDLDFKDEKISSLNKELEDLNTGGASEEEVATLKRQKHELEMRLKEEASLCCLLCLKAAFDINKPDFLMLQTVKFLKVLMNKIIKISIIS